MNQFDIYRIPNTQSSEIVEEYKLGRCSMNNPLFYEGIKKLYDANVSILNEMREDIYYEERILIEALNFLQYLMCFQKKPENAWLDYYRKMLSEFHSHGQLKYKQVIYTPKNYITKEDAVIIEMLNGVKLHYKTAKELMQDIGKSRAELVMRGVKKREFENENPKNNDWKKVDFAYILSLLL